MKTAFGNILEGILGGVQTHVVGDGESIQQTEAEFPQLEGVDSDEDSMQVEILGMKPINFGFLLVGILGATVLGIVLYKKYNK
ncbi:MAG: hypothetical protein HRT57_10520 [Crocinitomicaceae bacterium]|nr:hypothetical protein [Crocinitomicaceae bacterium]